MNLYLASYVLCIGIKKMFRKLSKILNQQDPNFFSVCFIRAMVCLPLPTFFAVFRRWRTKLMRRENGHKIEKFDLRPQFTSCANEGPSSFHLHLLLSSLFIHVSLFFSWVLDGATSSKQLKTARGRFSLMF